MVGNFVRTFRNFSTNKVLLESMSEPLKAEAKAKGHHANPGMWRNMFLFLGCPSMVIAYLNCQMSEEPAPPEFVKYSYLRIRNKQYPWRDGVKTLFHNPHTNALPDGYEHA